jgi:hypothetical protein
LIKSREIRWARHFTTNEEDKKYVDESLLLKWILKEMRCGFDLTGSGQGLVSTSQITSSDGKRQDNYK